MTGTLISLGANLGNPLESMHAARRLLIDSIGAPHIRFSQLFRTPPVGGPEGQNDFLNAVVAIESSHSAWEIWDLTKSIETTLGRQRQHRWESRRIDIDLILHHDERIWTPHLKVPHPRMCMRTFVLQPACEIASDWIDPVTGWSIRKLSAHLSDRTSLSCSTHVVTPSVDQRMVLQTAFEAREGSRSLNVQWSSTTDLGKTMELICATKRDDQHTPCKLMIAAVASPDPMTILWEDYSLAWATQLGLRVGKVNAHHASSFPFLGPRYLLPANDIAWAVHEIHAAHQAMTCLIEPVPGAW